MNCQWFSHDMDVLSEISQPQCSLCKNEFECSAIKCLSIHESAASICYPKQPKGGSCACHEDCLAINGLGPLTVVHCNSQQESLERATW